MENFNHSLPGIAQIGYCLCENIQPNIVLKHSSGIPVGVFTEITPVRFFGQPSYEAVEEYDNNGRKVLCTLKFVSNDNIPLHKHLAFVITDASGTSTSALVNDRTLSPNLLPRVATPQVNRMPLPTKLSGHRLVCLFVVPYKAVSLSSFYS